MGKGGKFYFGYAIDPEFAGRCQEGLEKYSPKKQNENPCLFDFLPETILSGGQSKKNRLKDLLALLTHFDGVVTLKEVLEGHPILQICLEELYSEKMQKREDQITEMKAQDIIKKLKGS